MLFLCLLLGVAVSSTTADCTLPLPRFAIFPPLVFSKNGNLLPTNGLNEHHLSITIPADEELILSCAPGYFKNEKFNGTKWLNAKCVNDAVLVDGTNAPNLRCEVRPVEEIVKSVPGCPRDAKSVEFGYENPIKQKTFVIGEACYNENEGRTIFVHTKFVKNGNAKSAILETESVNYLAREHPDSRYKMGFLAASRLDLVNERLKKLLSTRKIPFLESRHFIDLPTLQNGQLYSALKLGWNFAIANGYDHLPNYDLLIEDLMSINDNSFELYFGTHSILSLQSETKGPVELYFIPEDRKYPVPKYLWIVATTESGSGAGFLISNDINANVEELTSDAVCESKCAQMTWMTNLLNKDAYKKPKNGFITCCDLNSFKNKVSEMPSIEGKYDLLTQNNLPRVRPFRTRGK